MVKLPSLERLEKSLKSMVIFTFSMNIKYLERGSAKVMQKSYYKLTKYVYIRIYEILVFALKYVIL